MAQRLITPGAQKRPKAAAPLDGAHRVIRRILDPDGRDAGEWGAGLRTEEMPAVALDGTGSERPVPEWVELAQTLYRVFAFVDVCGFTAYTDRHGAHAAIEVLTRFRSASRDVATRRGARVAKWLGDGVMLVGSEPGPVLATVGELLLRFRDDPFDVHAGIAGGKVLLFEGDDYIGRAVNLAARLCEAATPGEALCVGLDDELPAWLNKRGSVTVRAHGIGDIAHVTQLHVDDDAWALPETAGSRPTTVS